MSPEGTLRAFTPDGQRRFETKLPVQGSFGTPSLAATAAIGPDGTIYVGSLAPFGTTPIIAVDAETGMPRWTSTICRAALGFVAADGDIYGTCWPEGCPASIRFSDSAT